MGARGPPPAAGAPEGADPTRALLLPLRLVAAALVEAGAGEGAPEGGLALVWDATGLVFGGLEGYQDLLPVCHFFLVRVVCM